MSAASSVNKLKKDLKSIKKAFTMVNTQLAQLKEADSDISESEGEEASHFQVDQALQFVQPTRSLSRESLSYSNKQDPQSNFISRRLFFSTVNPPWIFSVTQPW
jgi:hypothetical protein